MQGVDNTFPQSPAFARVRLSRAGPGCVWLITALLVTSAPKAPVFGNEEWRVEDVFVAGDDGDAFVFASVTAMAFGTSGELAVLDGTSAEVLVLSASTGALLRRFGRRGQGPGEFVNPTLISVSASGEIFVYDRRAGDRLSRFGPDGSFLGSATPPRSAAVFVGMAVTRKGFLLMERPLRERPGRPLQKHPRLTLVDARMLGQTVWEWGDIETGPPLARGEPRPLFESSPRWSLVAADRIAVASSDRYELAILDLEGGVRHIVEHLVDPVPLTAKFKESISAERAGSARPEIVFPDFYPLISRILPASEETFIVERSDGVNIRWEVFSLAGEPLAALNAPSSFLSMAAHDGLVAGMHRTAQQEIAVRLVRIERSR